jgi:hypothetical protein
MATTTERQRRSSKGAVAASSLRLYLGALLAAAYVGAFGLFGLRPPARSDQETRALEAAPQTSPGQAMIVWFHDLPATQRPAVKLPAGWHIADRTPSSPGVTGRRVPVPVRASPARTGRLRTRSS